MYLKVIIQLHYIITTLHLNNENKCFCTTDQRGLRNVVLSQGHRGFDRSTRRNKNKSEILETPRVDPSHGQLHECRIEERTIHRF